MLGGRVALESTGSAFGEEAFLIDVYEGGGVMMLKMSPESLPSLYVSVACEDRASHM